MKLMSVGVLLAAMTMGSVCLNADSEAIPMENRISLQFIVKLLETLKDVSPEQEQAFSDYDKQLRVMLMDARQLQREHHLAEQRGLRGSEDVAKTHQEGKVLLEKALVRTETYLESLLKGLKQHREEIKLSLLPKPE